MTEIESKEKDELLIRLGHTIQESIFDYEMILYEPILDEETDEIYGRYIFNKGVKDFNILITTDYEIKLIERNIPRKLLLDISNILIRVALNEDNSFV
jgi:hypothetical protein